MEKGKVVGVKGKDIRRAGRADAPAAWSPPMAMSPRSARWAGIETTLKPADITTCFQYRLTDLKTRAGLLRVHLGSARPGGYVWVFPKGDDTANVGIGVQLSKLKQPGEVKMYLDKFIKKDPRLKLRAAPGSDRRRRLRLRPPGKDRHGQPHDGR